MKAKISSIWGHKCTMPASVTRAKQATAFAALTVILLALQHSCKPSLASDDEIVTSNRRASSKQVQSKRQANGDNAAASDKFPTQLISRSHRASGFDNPNLSYSLTLKMHPINKRAANAISSNSAPDDESNDDDGDNLNPAGSEDYAPADSMPALVDQSSLHSSPSPSPSPSPNPTLAGREFRVPPVSNPRPSSSQAGSNQAPRSGQPLNRRATSVGDLQPASGSAGRSTLAADNSSPRSSRPSAWPVARNDDLHTSVDQRAQPTVNLNIGTERLLIKPASERPWANSMTTAASIMPNSELETATESISRHQYASSDSNGVSNLQPSSHHHLDLQYPSAHSSLGNIQPQADQTGASSRRQMMISMLASDFDARMDQLEANTNSQPTNAICYTPVAFALVILVCMTITILVCIFTHLMLKHWGRHQFGKLLFTLYYEPLKRDPRLDSTREL